VNIYPEMEEVKEKNGSNRLGNSWSMGLPVGEQTEV
jgi:hypothetical protein